MKSTCVILHQKVVEIETRVDTRHTLMMWFLGVAGSIMVIMTGLAMNIGTDISKTLLKVSTTQTELSTTMKNITTEVTALREWRVNLTERTYYEKRTEHND